MQDIKKDIQVESIDKLEEAVNANTSKESTHLQLDPTPKDSKKQSDLVIAGNPSVGEPLVGSMVKLRFAFLKEEPGTVKRDDGAWVAEREYEIKPLSVRQREVAIWGFVELFKLFGGDSIQTLLRQARENYLYFLKFDDAVSAFILALIGLDPSDSEYLELGSGSSAFISLLDSNPNIITEIESFLGIRDQESP